MIKNDDTRTTFTVTNFLNFVSSCFVLLKKDSLQLTYFIVRTN